ncbi:hypothetical protein FA95DRAFT_1568091 [Auriscalpium vulgare]|uniref:Uncharacterized protein n=1 Tax=Auriscalpium vulgare TaxID=40419 RepID=A0ACB8R1C0_9AGAM|nr:hypothetical protein FA95DRAFT_1568091 [Auriscalpium vulgare]
MTSPVYHKSTFPSLEPEINKVAGRAYEMLINYMKSHPRRAQKQLLLRWQEAMIARNQVPTKADNMLSLAGSLITSMSKRFLMGIIPESNESRQGMVHRPAPDNDDGGDDDGFPPVENLNVLIEILEGESEGCNYCKHPHNRAVAFASDVLDGVVGVFRKRVTVERVTTTGAVEQGQSVPRDP